MITQEQRARLRELAKTANNAYWEYHLEEYRNVCADDLIPLLNEVERLEAELKDVVDLGEKIRNEATMQDPFDEEETFVLLKQWDAIMVKYMRDNALKGGLE